MSTAEMYADAVMACADLVGRAGAASFELGWDCPHTPGEPDDHDCGQATWHAHAQYRGARVQTAEHRTPTAAAMALAERLLRGAQCRCTRLVALSDGHPDRCRWQLIGKRWEPGCDAEPLKVKGERGDGAAMVAAMQQRAAAPDRRPWRRRKGRGRT